ncbi:sugar isomerase domain-containing protein [Thermocrispum municipale]|uniref:sugar isomerase domain-containing protein n=1 Tax=Thermocrispum municipale TaxID=37926 RepID=UPI00040A14C6|nr:SIS domain-containing protein [Thermocrispum municipale]
MTPELSAAGFAKYALSAMADVAEKSAEPVDAAAELIADAVRSDGIVQAFGTGHSQAVALEIAGRAGGLIPTNRIRLTDLVVVGGDQPDVLADQLLERQPGLAERLYELAGARTGDVFVIASNSGVNAVISEMARLVKDKGHPLIAITSMEHTSRVTPSDPEGRRLADFADVVLDNGAPYGDAVLPLPGGGTACGFSSLSAGLLVQMMVAEAIRKLVDAGVEPPVYVSSNVPGGFERNREIEKRYEGRIRRLAG